MHCGARGPDWGLAGEPGEKGDLLSGHRPSGSLAWPRLTQLLDAPCPPRGDTCTEGLAPRGSKFLLETGHSVIKAAISPAEKDGDLQGCPCCLPWAWGLPATGFFNPHLAWASSALPPAKVQTSPSASYLHPGSSDAPNSAQTTLSTGPPLQGTGLGQGPATVVLAAPSPKSLSSPLLCHAQLSLDTDTCQKGDLTLSPRLRNLQRLSEPQGEAAAPPHQGPPGLGLPAGGPRPLPSANLALSSPGSHSAL